VIVDFHVHIFPPEITANRARYQRDDAWFGLLYENPKATTACVEDLISAMDEAGVDKTVVFGFGWSDHGLCAETNDYTLDAVARYPDRLIGFCNVNPARGDKAVKEIVRCVEAGMCGLGELMPNGQGYALDDVDVMAPIAAVCRSYDIPIMTHTSEPVGHDYCGKGTVGPRTVYRFVQAFPETKVVCAHWGGGIPFYELMPEVKRAMRNVYYDTAASTLLYDAQIFPLMYQLIGKKILFGTDYSLLHPRIFIDHIRQSGLSEEGQVDVLGENARRLLPCLDGSCERGDSK
jgi:uncharacterized protein